VTHVGGIPIAPPGQTQEVAELVAFLASDRGPFHSRSRVLRQNSMCTESAISSRDGCRGLGQVGATESATQFTKNLLKRRERRHLIGQASVPERSRTGLFSRERGLQVLAGFCTEFQSVKACRSCNALTTAIAFSLRRKSSFQTGTRRRLRESVDFGLPRSTYLQRLVYL
jgi:hypothetical protein